MAKEKVVIVIHVYKEELTEYEKISLTQLTKILGHYPVIITAPPQFSGHAYRAILKDQLKSVIRYPLSFFNGLKGYNRLMLSKMYYQALAEYEYALLYHTDAFVFKDELSFWMDKQYDYIGAPIYDFDGTRNPKNYRCVGNGGFSLRKVETFCRLADSNQVIYKLADIKDNFSRYNWRGKLKRSIYYIALLTTWQSRLNSKRRGVRENEDIIWGCYVSKYIPGFKVAPFEDSYQFSMEFNCDLLMKRNNGELPFGCHGWYKDLFIDFWRPYISQLGI